MHQSCSGFPLQKDRTYHWRGSGGVLGYSRRSLGLPYAAEPLRVEHKVTSWASTETNQPWVSQGNFLTSGSSVSQADLRNETASFRAQSGRQSYEPRGPVPMGSQADLRTEIALLRAQMGRQSNEPHGTESNTSQADLRTETASFDRTQTGKQSYEPHGPAPTGSQADLRTEVAFLRAQIEGQPNEPHGPVPMASQADLRAEITLLRAQMERMQSVVVSSMQRAASSRGAPPAYPQH